MPRDIKHFEDRLEKDNYSKDEVAKMLHNEADFTNDIVKKNYDGMVSKEDYDKVTSELDIVKGELKPFRENAFTKSVNAEFSKLNGLEDRVGDFTSLAKLTGNESPEDIAIKVSEFKDDDKYGFMFKSTDSGGSKDKVNLDNNKKKVSSKGILVPTIGSFNLFKKKK